MLCSSELLGIIFKLLQESYINTILQLLGQDTAANPQTLLKLAIRMHKVHNSPVPFMRAEPQTRCRPCVTVMLMAKGSGTNLEPLL